MDYEAYLFHQVKEVMDMRVLLIGPQGCGKTRNAKKIARTFGLSSIFDGFDTIRFGGPSELRDDGLFIGNKLPRGIRREHFDIVIEVNGEATIK